MGLVPVIQAGAPMLNLLIHTTAQDSRTLEQRAKDHARNLDVKAEPVALQRWAQKSKELIEQLVQRVDALEKGTV